MKLRFEVDQAECFRRGIDCPKSIVTVEVNPKDLTQDQRNAIADRLSGIDVLELRVVDGEARQNKGDGWIVRIKAKEPTFEAMMAAIAENKEGFKSRSRDGVSPTSVNIAVLSSGQAASVKAANERR